MKRMCEDCANLTGYTRPTKTILGTCPICGARSRTFLWREPATNNRIVAIVFLALVVAACAAAVLWR